MRSVASKLARSNDTRALPAQNLGHKHVTILCLLLFVVTLAFYHPLSHDGFVLLDDVPYIAGNPQVQAGLTWSTIEWSFTTFHAGYWHPVTWLSHALDCQLFGINPVGHHYVNLLFHTANVVLLFLLLLEATGLTWPSVIVAMLFAVHPINVESVAWAAERKNVLSMFFFLLALWAYDRYARRGGAKRYAVVVALFALGLMAKPQIITLPFVLLLWDYWPLQRMFETSSQNDSPPRPQPRSFGFLLREKIPFFLLVIASAIVTVLAQRSADAVRTLSQMSFSSRVENAVVSYVRYMANLVGPHDLAPLYPYPTNRLPILEVGLCLGVLAALSAAALYWRRLRFLAVGWFWFLGVLVPMIGIVQVGEQAMADRFVYIPMVGLEISVVWALWELVQAKKGPEKWIVAPMAAIVLVLGALTYHQLGYWKNAETLWNYTLSVTRDNYMAHETLAMELNKQGRLQEALPHFEAAEALHDFPLPQVLTLGVYEQRNGRPQKAVELYEKVLHRSADSKIDAMAWSQIGSATVQMKNYDQAIPAYEKALQFNPKEPSALVGSGLLAERNGDFSLAAQRLAQAVHAEPSDLGFLLLAEALRRVGRQEQASENDALAAKISANLMQAQQNARDAQSFYGYTPPATTLHPTADGVPR